MTQQEFRYVPRFDWEREIARSQRKTLIQVGAAGGLSLALWALIWVAVVGLLAHPPAIPLP
jgi:hypothetical protein